MDLPAGERGFVGACVMWCDDPETVALELAEDPEVELVDTDDDAVRALERRLGNAPTSEEAALAAMRQHLGPDDPALGAADETLVARADTVMAVAATVLTATERLEAGTNALAGNDPLPLALARSVVAHDDRDAADLNASPEELRAAAAAVRAAADHAHAAQDSLPPSVGAIDRFDLEHVRHAIDLANRRRLAAGRATSILAGALAATTGLVILIHAGRLHPVFDIVPVSMLIAACKYQRYTRADARLVTSRAGRLLTRLHIDDADQLEAMLDARVAWQAAFATVTTADAMLQDAWRAWQAIAGDADPDDVDVLITERERRDRDRVFARASLEWHAAREALAAARASLMMAGFGSATHAEGTIEAARQRIELRAAIADAHADSAQLSATIDLTALRPLVICLPGAPSGALIDFLARTRAPLSVTMVTNHVDVASAAIAAGIAVVDFHTHPAAA